MGVPACARCVKCQSVFFGNTETLPVFPGGEGVCPADGKKHDPDQSQSYKVTTGRLKDHQIKWQICWKCQSLFYNASAGGVCPDGGGPHQPQTRWGPDGLSLLYEKVIEGKTTGLVWRKCSKCEVLFYAGVAKTHCAAGGRHDMTGSGRYALYIHRWKW